MATQAPLHKQTGFPSANQRQPTLITPQDSTSWTWGTIQSGDCTMTTPSLVLNSDGVGNFVGYVTSPDEGDVWIVQGLALIDNHGLELYRTAQFDSTPNLMPGDTIVLPAVVYFPAYMYPYVNSITMYCHC